MRSQQGALLLSVGITNITGTYGVNIDFVLEWCQQKSFIVAMKLF